MSLRRAPQGTSPEDASQRSAVPLAAHNAHVANALLTLGHEGETFATRFHDAARIACSYSSYTGTQLPCGAICSYGDGTHADAFVVSTKSMMALDPNGDKLVKLSPSSMTKGMMAVQSIMNNVTGTMMYGNIYGFQTGTHTYALDHMEQIATMNSRHMFHAEGKMADVFKKVHDVLKTEYPMGYTYSTFRYMGYRITGSY